MYECVRNIVVLYRVKWDRSCLLTTKIRQMPALVIFAYELPRKTHFKGKIEFKFRRET